MLLIQEARDNAAVVLSQAFFIMEAVIVSPGGISGLYNKTRVILLIYLYIVISTLFFFGLSFIFHPLSFTLLVFIHSFY